MKRLNLFSDEPFDMNGMTYHDFLTRQLSNSTLADRSASHADHTHKLTGSPTISALTWLGLYDDTPMNRALATPFDVTADLMIGKMLLSPGERDMVVMQHTFLASYSDGRKEVIRSRMLDFGIPGGDTSVARTVALPAAIGVEMILNGEIGVKGVHIPVIPEIYHPVLDQLDRLGIRMHEEYGLPLSENIN
jgi:hypothetical protein